jgi:hypothetical protein
MPQLWRLSHWYARLWRAAHVTFFSTPEGVRTGFMNASSSGASNALAHVERTRKRESEKVLGHLFSFVMVCIAGAPL